VFVAHLVHAQAQAPAPDLSTLPEACVNGGTELQTFCSDTITAAQTFFNVVSRQNLSTMYAAAGSKFV
jgi:hypothetical protein